MHATSSRLNEICIDRSEEEPTFIEFMKDFKPRWDDLKREFGG